MTSLLQNITKNDIWEFGMTEKICLSPSACITHHERIITGQIPYILPWTNTESQWYGITYDKSGIYIYIYGRANLGNIAGKHIRATRWCASQNNHFTKQNKYLVVCSQKYVVVLNSYWLFTTELWHPAVVLVPNHYQGNQCDSERAIFHLLCYF